MFNLTRKKTILYLIAIASLVLGGAIYVIFRENTYIARLFREIFSVDSISYDFISIDCDFLKFYLVDYLWALSLSCGLHIIFFPEFKGSMFCTGIVSVIGIIYELMQWKEVIGGTGDWMDIILYFLAGITVNIIYFKGVVKNEKGT